MIEEEKCWSCGKICRPAQYAYWVLGYLVMIGTYYCRQRDVCWS